MKKYCLLFIPYLLISISTHAQTNPRFWDDVKTIKNYDKMFKVPEHPILFIGSSSIRKWDDLQLKFGNLNVLNRGIGGAVINDITIYLKDLAYDYQPRQIVIYVGENDVVSAEETADTILNRTVRLYNSIRIKMPIVPIIYIALKPSPVRDQFTGKTMQANKLIQHFLSKEANVVFLDVFPLMLKDGHSRPELFVEDMLHMNQQGYDIWEKAIKPYLLPI